MKNISVCDPFRLQKLLNMAGDPSAYDAEKLNAVRLAQAHCAKHGLLLGDAAITAVEKDVFFAFSMVPNRTLWKANADLQVALDVLHDQAAEKDALIADQRDKLAAKDATTADKNAEIAERDAQIAALKALLQDALARAEQRDQKLSEPDGAEDVIATIVEHPIISPIPSTERADVDRDEKIARDPAKASLAALRWTRRRREKLYALVATGMSKARIARLLACEFCRRVSVASVSQMMRQRWQPDAEGYLWPSS